VCIIILIIKDGNNNVPIESIIIKDAHVKSYIDNRGAQAAKGCRRTGWCRAILHIIMQRIEASFLPYRERRAARRRSCLFLYISTSGSTIYASSFVFPCFNEHHSSTILSLALFSGAPVVPPTARRRRVHMCRRRCRRHSRAAHLNSCAPPSIPTPIVRPALLAPVDRRRRRHRANHC
jgi:hypothetical protein